MGSLLGRDAILGADDIETREVEVPSWGGTVLVRGLSGAERDAYEASCMQERPALDEKGRPIKGQTEMTRSLLNIRAKLVVRCLVDESGERIFTNQDANALGQKSAAALDRLFDVAAELSRLTSEDIDELGKASAGTPADDSISA